MNILFKQIIAVTLLTLSFVSVSQADTPIRGQVLTPQGAPLRNARVNVVRQYICGVDSSNVVSFYIYCNQIVASATTSSFGYYSIEGVPSGGYYLTVDSRRYRFGSVGVYITPSGLPITFGDQGFNLIGFE